MVRACTALSNAKAGKQVHGIASVSRLDSDPFVQSSLAHMYVKCSQLKDAGKLLDERLNETWFPGLLGCEWVIWTILILGSQIQWYVFKLGMESNKCVVSTLMDMYGKSGCSSQMSQVFDEMDVSDIGACTALVSGRAFEKQLCG
ncbi:hypothetical protein RHGRI_003528 [Rhododendron griersonianum]|uniref:Pentatricopeptide repeat-containing protein n=1 Tax=Rhododendron griersonianum TaxID=479676 RepID=A0AAV6L8G0_9ERIC|nr:hypothetical protein RHGRI_003528 [Rhododendron griersonianum]